MQVKTSDLFQKKGFTFDYFARMADQNILIKRMSEIEVEQVKDLTKSLTEFADSAVCSMVFIEYVIDHLKKLGVEVT